MKKYILLILVMSICVSIVSCTRNAHKVENKPIEKPKNNYQSTVVTPPKEDLPTPSQQNAPTENNSKNSTTVPESKIFYKDKTVVLTYHHISEKPVSSITIKPARFEADLKMLKDNNFNVISLKDMIAAMQGKSKLPANAVVITFDDGYESFYKYAYPLFKKYNMPGLCFIITSWMDNYKSTGTDLNPMSPSEVSEMYKSGIIDIQSHSYNGHDYITKDEKGKIGGMLAYKIYDPKLKKYESNESYVKRVKEDLSISRSDIKKFTGAESDIFCFPFGHYNSELVELGKQVGFKYFVTTVYGNNKVNTNTVLIKRIRSGDAKLTTEELKKNIISCGRGSSVPATQ